MSMNAFATQQENEPVSVGEWVIAYLLQLIPIVGIVMLFIWAFGDTAKPSKANWAKATLIWIGISFLLGICIWVVMFIIIGSAGNMQY